MILQKIRKKMYVSVLWKAFDTAPLQSILWLAKVIFPLFAWLFQSGRKEEKRTLGFKQVKQRKLSREVEGDMQG